MIIIICGKPRVGKTALNTHFADYSLQVNGRLRLKRAIAETHALNLTRANNKLIIPDVPPIYTNYEARFIMGYKKYFKPFWVNPFYLALPNQNPTQDIFPFGELHITEGQRYWDSRESSSLSNDVSRYFEMHGHFGLDIIIDVQRAGLIDLNIRALAIIIEVQRMVHYKDAYGRILSTTWYCKEFANNQDYEAYVAGKEAFYITTSYTHEGNIFELYNSRSCKEEFVPAENKNFTLLKYLSQSEVKMLPNETAQYYSNKMPAWFRDKKAQKTDTEGMKNGRSVA